MILDEDGSRFNQRNDVNTPNHEKEKDRLDIMSQPSKRISKLKNKNFRVDIDKRRDIEENPIIGIQEVKSP